MMELLLARHPNHLDSIHPRIIEDLLTMIETDQQNAVNAIIEMLTDLHQHGLETRYAKKLQGIRIWELKTRSRGGIKGGARVYFYPKTSITGETRAVIINAEVKEGDQASNQKLLEAAEILIADEKGITVISTKETP